MNPVTVVALVLLFAIPVAFAISALRRALGRPAWAWARLADRADVVSQASESVLILLLGRALLPWHRLPDVLWVLALFVAVFAVVVAGLLWPRLPLTRPGARTPVRWAGSATSALAAGLALAFMA